MRYCFTEAEKAQVTVELSLADLAELHTVLQTAADFSDATHRTKRIAREVREYYIEAAEAMAREARATLRQLKGDDQ